MKKKGPARELLLNNTASEHVQTHGVHAHTYELSVCVDSRMCVCGCHARLESQSERLAAACIFKTWHLLQMRVDVYVCCLCMYGRLLCVCVCAARACTDVCCVCVLLVHVRTFAVESPMTPRPAIRSPQILFGYFQNILAQP